MFFNFLLGRAMAAAEDEETFGGNVPADRASNNGDATGASRDDAYDDDDAVDDAGSGSTDTAVRLEDVLLQLTEAEQKEDAALQASFSGISEEDRLVLMQFLPQQLEHLKEDKNGKEFTKKDESSNINPPPPSTNGFAEQEPTFMTKPQPSVANGLAEQESPPEINPGNFAEQEDSPAVNASSTNGLDEQEPSPKTKPRNLAEQVDSSDTEPHPSLSDKKPLPLPGAMQGHQERKSEESAKLDEILKELKSIRRRQTITHCLLSALIVVTAVWQFSEVSVILSVKEKISHPFRSIGGFFSRALLGGEKMHILEKMPSPPLEVSQLSHIKLPDLSEAANVDFSSAVIESIED